MAEEEILLETIAAASIAFAVAGAFTFDLRYFDTNGDEAGYAGPNLIGSRLVGSVAVGF